jgi:site-specific recombinase XerD
MGDRLCLPAAAWPEGDRRLWLGALDPGGRRRFSVGPQAPQMPPGTRRKTEGGYGRWVSFLAASGRLDPAAAPGARVTEEAVAAWLDDLRAHGNADHTIVGRLEELKRAMAVLAPGQDFGWLTRPGGVPIRARLPMRRRALTVHHPRALFEWGLELVERARTLPGADRRRVMLRDGVMIMLLAARAPRLRSLAALRLGVNTHREAEGWRIDLGEADIKTGRALSYGLPAALEAALDRYVEVERAEMLGGKVEEALWINWDGRPLQTRGVEKRIRWWSEKRFGKGASFGPHRFRHCVATAAPIADPEAPTIGASVLGITARTAKEAYDRGSRAAAATRFHAGLAEERARTAALARNIFGRRRRAPREDGERTEAGK